MNIEYKNFIGIYDNVYPEGYCEHLISEFDRLALEGVGSNRIQSENANRHVKNDLQMGFQGQTVTPFNTRSAVDIFFNGLQECYNEYTSKFSVLRDANILCTHMKLQRTDPGGGYHVWHGEQGNGEQARRVLVYMLYLNDLPPESAGETEFLYLKERYQPVKNRMILWPASYTHAHRGNTVFGEQSKYIVTGWFYYN